jgi:hypothetical protein
MQVSAHATGERARLPARVRELGSRAHDAGLLARREPGITRSSTGTAVVATCRARVGATTTTTGDAIVTRAGKRSTRATAITVTTA